MAKASFLFEPDPAQPGWMTWRLPDDTRFNGLLGPIRVKREGERARCRIIPRHELGNLNGVVHGGVVLSLIDISMFAGSRALGFEEAGRSVTVDLSTQFLSPGNLDEPLDSVVEIARETGKLLFMRGVVEQSHGLVASFQGLVRKARPEA